MVRGKIAAGCLKFACQHNTDVLSQGVNRVMCSHSLMFKHLYCSAPKAAVGEPGAEEQCVEKLRVVGMTANAVKGTS